MKAIPITRSIKNENCTFLSNKETKLTFPVDGRRVASAAAVVLLARRISDGGEAGPVRLHNGNVVHVLFPFWINNRVSKRGRNMSRNLTKNNIGKKPIRT